MSSKHRLTRSFRTLSALLYVLNLIVGINFAAKPRYLDILVGVMVGIISIVMLCVTIEAPPPVISRLEASRIGEQLFTFRGRYMVDLFLALFLFAMGIWGIIMGALTLILIFGIRFVGVKQPEAFNEIFRQSDIESTGDTYTLDDSEGQGGR